MRPGTDAYLLLGMAATIVARGLTDETFVLAQALNAGISVNSPFPGPSHLIVDGKDTD